MDMYELHMPWLQIVGGAEVREGVVDHLDGLVYLSFLPISLKNKP
jgi:hypothetical protein